MKKVSKRVGALLLALLLLVENFGFNGDSLYVKAGQQTDPAVTEKTAGVPTEKSAEGEGKTGGETGAPVTTPTETVTPSVEEKFTIDVQSMILFQNVSAGKTVIRVKEKDAAQPAEERTMELQDGKGTMEVGYKKNTSYAYTITTENYKPYEGILTPSQAGETIVLESIKLEPEYAVESGRPIEISGKESTEALSTDVYRVNVKDAWKSLVTWEIDGSNNSSQTKLAVNPDGVQPENACTVKHEKLGKFSLICKIDQKEAVRKEITVHPIKTRLEIVDVMSGQLDGEPLRFTVKLSKEDGTLLPEEARPMVSIKVDDKNDPILGAEETVALTGGSIEREYLLKSPLNEITITASYMDPQEVYSYCNSVVHVIPGQGTVTKAEEILHVPYGKAGYGEEYLFQLGTGETILSAGVEQPETDTDVVEVMITGDGNGFTIQPNRAGTRKVVFSVETNDYIYKLPYEITVDPLQLSVASVKTGGSGTAAAEAHQNKKTYDGTNWISAAVKLVNMNPETPYEEVLIFNHECREQLGAGNHGVNISFAELDEKFRASHMDQNMQLVDTRNGAGYDGSIEVEKKELQVTVNDAKRAIGSTEYLYGEVDGQKTPPVVVTGFVAGEDSDVSSRMVLPVVKEDIPEAEMTPEYGPYIGIHGQALVLDFAGSDPTENYVFDLVNYTRGSLEILPEEMNVQDPVSNEKFVIDVNGSRRVFRKDDDTVIYFNNGPEKDGAAGESALLKISGPVYNRFLEDPENGTGVLAEQVELLAADAVDAQGKKVVAKHVALSNEAKTYCTQPLDLQFVLDQEAPDCEIEIKTEKSVKSKIEDLASAITFGAYSNKQVDAYVTLTDPLSGVKEWSYCVIDVKNDQKYEEALQGGIDKLEEYFAYKVFTAPEENSNKISLGVMNEQKLKDGAYVVFVKAVDHLDNAKIYGSTGIVLEDCSDMEIQYTVDTQPAPKVAENVSYCQNDTELNIKAMEKADSTEGDVYSGIQYIEYTMKKTDGKGKVVEESQKYQNPADLDVPLAQIQKELIYKEKFSADSSNSMKVEVRANAVDHAGNKMQGSDYAFVVDAVKPEVSVTIKKDNNKDLLWDEQKQRQYADSPVTYKVDIKERYTDFAGSYIRINGVDYTFDQLKTDGDLLKGLGITVVEISDCPEKQNAVDAGTCTLTLMFEKQGRYEVAAHVKDLSGNETSQTADLVYDTQAPGCSIKIKEENPVELSVEQLDSPITFGKYKNQDTEVAIVVRDQPEKDVAENGEAGVKAWSYCVKKVDKDQSYEAALQDAVFKKAEVNEGGETILPLKEKDTDPFQDGNYVIFVKVSDYAGNEKIYGSTGVILENCSDMDLIYHTDQEVQPAGDKVTYYKENTQLDIQAVEKAAHNVYSGIHTIRYNLTYTDGKGESTTKEGTWHGEGEDLLEPQVLLSQIRKDLTYSEMIPADSGSSIKVDVQAQAMDFAGNEKQGEVVSLVVDAVQPDVAVTTKEAGNNDHLLTYVGDPWEYANDVVVYGMKVKERYLDFKESYLTINGQKYNFGQLMDSPDLLKKQGISIEEIEHSREVTDTVDESPCNFNLRFEKQGRYEIISHVQDLSGNIKETKNCLVYDTQAPKCNIRIEAKKNVEAAIENFLNMISFGAYNKQLTKAYVTVEDQPEKGVAAEEVSDVKEWSYCVVETKNDISYQDALKTATFKKTEDGRNQIPLGEMDGNQLKDGTYVIFVKAVDRSGNAKIYGSTGVVLEDCSDMKITYQTSTAAYPDGREPRHYKETTGLSIMAEEQAKDGVYSGVDYISYTIEKTDGKGNGSTVDEKHYSNGEEGADPNVLLSQILKELEYKTTVEADGENSVRVDVRAHAVDFAGNAGDEKTYSFVVDAVLPKIATGTEEVQGDAILTYENTPWEYANHPVKYSVNIEERYLNLQKSYITINHTDYTLRALKDNPEYLKNLGIDIQWNQDETGNQDVTDASICNFALIFKEDGSYDVTIHAWDLSENETVKENQFILDQVQPKIQAVYTLNKVNGAAAEWTSPLSQRAYANGDVRYISVLAKIEETNFSLEQTPVNGSISVQTADLSPQDTVNVDQWNEKFVQNGNWYSLGEEFVQYNNLPSIQVDANYAFIYGYTDLAGNEAEVVVDYLTLDRRVPEGNITVDNMVNGSALVKWDTWLNNITFGLFGRHVVGASMGSSDITSGVYSTEYLLADNAMNKTQLHNREDWRTYDRKLDIPANQNVVVYEKAVDVAGNVEYYNSDGIIVDDQTQGPQIVITPSSPAWGKDVYSASDQPGFDITVIDPAVNNAYAGLHEITYTIMNGVTGDREEQKIDIGKGDHLQRWTAHVNIDPERFYSNDVKVFAKATDWSTNESESEITTIKVDNHAPVVSFSFDRSDVDNNKYYKNNKNLTITVQERNFDPSYLPVVTSSTGAGYSFSGWSSNGETHTGVVTFSGDSDYKVTYDCYDLAGNKSNTETLDEITVDKTAPVITVSYNNDNARNTSYYKETRVATVTITEHNFDPSRTHINALAVTGPSPAVSGWSSSGDRHTATVSFSADGEYTLDVDSMDLAGNTAEKYGQDRFTVDLTKPEILISGVEDKQAYNGVVQPAITVTDTNFSESEVSITLKGATKGEMDLSSLMSVTNTTNGRIYNIKNFEEGMDDIYVLTVTSLDQAGNENTSSITFSVNRDGSTYVVSADTQKLIKQKYVNKVSDIKLEEVNVNTLKFVQITYSKDGKVVTLEEGKDFKVVEEGGEGQWKKYSYVIYSKCFEKEGTYVINIYSEDGAGNTTTNKAKAKSIEFTVDKTAPSIIVSNLIHQGRYKEDTHRFTVNVKDNLALSYLELYKDGKLVRTYKAEELMKEDGVIHVELKSRNEYQKISLKACDAAGNMSKSAYVAEIQAEDKTVPAEFSVLVTANAFVQFYMNKSLFYGSIIILLLLLLLIGYWIWIKREHDKRKRITKS